MTTSPVMTLTEELLSELEEAARGATPQNLDSAEVIEVAKGGMIECPVCCGEGYASLENDYCNFDNHAIGVQLYGIGNEFGAAERHYRAANPATVLALIARVRELEAREVELPNPPMAQRSDEEATFSAGACDMLRKCRASIEKAGVRVKP